MSLDITLRLPQVPLVVSVILPPKMLYVQSLVSAWLAYSTFCTKYLDSSGLKYLVTSTSPRPKYLAASTRPAWYTLRPYW